MRRIALQLLVEVAGVGKRRDLEALLAEIARQQVAQPHIVVDDEDLRWRGRSSHGGRVVARPRARTAAV